MERTHLLMVLHAASCQLTNQGTQRISVSQRSYQFSELKNTFLFVFFLANIMLLGFG